ncbi:unnamed protein product [Closterium sp. NIES-53]
MIHAATPHFLWPFVIRYVAHQLNLWPRVSLLETPPTLRWTGKVGDASVFRVWGSRACVRDTSADKLSARAIPCDVTFDESVRLYLLFPYHSALPPPSPLFLAPCPPPVDPLPPQHLAPSGVSQIDPLPGTVPVEVAVDSGAGSGGVRSGGAEPTGAEPGRAELQGVEPRGTKSEGAESGGAEPRGTASSGGPAGVSATCLGGAGVTARAGGTGGAAAACPGGARTTGTGAAGTGNVGGAGAGGAGARDPGAMTGGTEAGGAGAGRAGARGAGAGDRAEPGGAGPGGAGAGGTVRPQPFFVPLLRQVLSSPLLAPSPYAEQADYFTERCEPEFRLASPVRAARTSRRIPCPRPPPVPGTHVMALRPSSIPLRIPPPNPPASSLPAIPDPEADLARAASPTVSCLLATIVTGPPFESTAASALVAELVDFAAACRLDYAAALIAEYESASPPFVGGECALGSDVLEDRQEDFKCLAAAVPHLVAMLLVPEGDPDAPDIPTLRC